MLSPGFFPNLTWLSLITSMFWLVQSLFGLVSCHALLLSEFVSQRIFGFGFWNSDFRNSESQNCVIVTMERSIGETRMKKNGCILLILVGQLPLGSGCRSAARGASTTKLSQTHLCNIFLTVQSWNINRAIKSAFSEAFDH
jgi:hypothetical protein